MRSPPRPRYIDAQFDEHGLHFELDGQLEQHVPWSRVRFSSHNAHYPVLEDETGKLLRLKGAQLVCRVRRTDRSQDGTRADALQLSYFSKPEQRFTSRVDQGRYKEGSLNFKFLLGIYIVGLPAFFLFMMIHGYRSVPVNDAGIRVQNVILASAGALVLFTLVGGWRALKQIQRVRNADKAIEINESGIVTDARVYLWEEVDRVDQSFAGYFVATKSGQDLLLPMGGCASQIAHLKIAQLPVFGYKLFLVCLGIGLLSGPFFRAWFQYLMPEHELQIHYLGVSVMLTGIVLLLFGIVYWEVWSTKRQRAKSQ